MSLHEVQYKLEVNNILAMRSAIVLGHSRIAVAAISL